MKPNVVNINYPQTKEAKDIENILCLAVLITNDILPERSSVIDAQVYYDNLDQGCDSCPFANKCLACIINE